jgi:hypothetical protein
MEDVVKDTLTQIDAGKEVKFDQRLGTLRNASLRWIWKAYESLNKKEIVVKVSN